LGQKHVGEATPDWVRRHPCPWAVAALGLLPSMALSSATAFQGYRPKVFLARGQRGLIRRAEMEDFEGAAVTETLSRAVVELTDAGAELFGCDLRQVGAFR